MSIWYNFVKCVENNQSVVAVETPSGEKITYQELYQRSIQLSEYLRIEHGISRGDRVAVLLPGSDRIIESILAVLSLGCTYIPIDPEMPVGYQLHVIKTSQCRLVLSDRMSSIEACIALASKAKGFIINLDIEYDPSRYEQPLRLLIKCKDNLDAYIIFTSGSTGNPNGVLIRNDGIIKLAKHCMDLYHIPVGFRVLQYASISFDAAVFEMWNTLLNGGTLVISTRNDMLPGINLRDTIVERDINVIHIPPSSLMGMAQYAGTMPSLTSIIACGERCLPNVVSTWSSSRTHIFNAYGPTECTICTHIHHCSGDYTEVPIGRIVPWFNYLIHNEELLISGSDLSPGYVQNDELTQERFIYIDGVRYFRTKDKVRVVDDIHYYSGRLDNMVKFRGYRLELEAVEAYITKHPQVSECGVVLNQLEGRSELVAFIISEGVSEHSVGASEHLCDLSEQDLKNWMAERCPDYMIPTRVINVKSLPLMSNRSKLNRKALIDMIPKSEEIEMLDDQSTLGRLINIVQSRLNREVDPSCNLTALGCTSIDIVAIVNSINDHFNFKTERIPVSVVYEDKISLNVLAQCIDFRMEHGVLHECNIDLIRESTLPDNLQTMILREQPRQDQLSILVTGATGFLGRQIVIELCKRGLNVTLMIRGSEGRKRFQQLACKFPGFKQEYMSQITVVQGDLTQDGFGMSSDLYSLLSQTITSVIHSGADISYIKNYELLKNANVTGTLRVLEFCHTGIEKTLHHVSSMAVFGPCFLTSGWMELDEMTPYYENRDYLTIENGYVQSKWVAERLLDRAYELGSKIKIHRPGFIESPQEGSISNTDDFLCRYLKGCLELGCYPDLPLKYWLITPVDYIAQVMADVIISDYSLSPYRIHLTPESRHELSNNEIFQCMISMGYKLQPVDYFTFISKVEQIMASQNQSSPLYGVGSYITEKVFKGRYTILGLHYLTPKVQCTHTYEFLRRLHNTDDVGMKWDDQVMKDYIMKYVNQGWFPEPVVETD
uniref:Carrier domain-containing protein n=1 Tax=viral metagenome TaxID=1070528 RepID=A0A6C0BM02_9ZZZZ